jgi:hypothetical protein
MILVTVSSFKAFTSLKCSGTVVLIRIDPRSDGNRYGSCRRFRWMAKQNVEPQDQTTARCSR